MKYIEINKVSYGYTKKNLLFTNLTLSFSLGEYVGIIGKNGAGKTTLVRLLNGMLKPLAGQIRIAGKDIKNSSIADIATNVGFVFQNPNQMLFTNSVEKELILSLQKFNFFKKVVDEKIDDILQFFDMTDLKESNPRMLSRGEKQKLALATVLIQNPETIILDEPFSGIDYTQRLMIMNYLDKLYSQGKLIIIISHTLDLLAEKCTRIIGLKDGVICFDKPTAQFLADEANLSTLGLEQTPYLSFIYSLRKYGLPQNIIKQDDLITYFKNKK
jgi:energy-coupling factor transport system ATP-binding protein